MNTQIISKVESFLKDMFEGSSYLQENPADRDYRLEHSYRVANLAKLIALEEGFDVTNAVIAGLLHDVAYCEQMQTKEDWKNHGRRSAAIARPFLSSIGLHEHDVNEICYSIAIHVDDESDFPWERTGFSETVGDADNLDRFDTYRIYETLQHMRFSEKNLNEKKESVASMLERLHRLRNMRLGTDTANAIWAQRLDFYISFYEKLKLQLENSCYVL